MKVIAVGVLGLCGFATGAVAQTALTYQKPPRLDRGIAGGSGDADREGFTGSFPAVGAAAASQPSRLAGSN
jgi:hypothetical protein